MSEQKQDGLTRWQFAARAATSFGFMSAPGLVGWNPANLGFASTITGGVSSALSSITGATIAFYATPVVVVGGLGGYGVYRYFRNRRDNNLSISQQNTNLSGRERLVVAAPAVAMGVGEGTLGALAYANVGQAATIVDTAVGISHVGNATVIASEGFASTAGVAGVGYTFSTLGLGALGWGVAAGIDWLWSSRDGEDDDDDNDKLTAPLLASSSTASDQHVVSIPPTPIGGGINSDTATDNSAATSSSSSSSSSSAARPSVLSTVTATSTTSTATITTKSSNVNEQAAADWEEILQLAVKNDPQAKVKRDQFIKKYEKMDQPFAVVYTGYAESAETKELKPLTDKPTSIPPKELANRLKGFTTESLAKAIKPIQDFLDAKQETPAKAQLDTLAERLGHYGYTPTYNGINYQAFQYSFGNYDAAKAIYDQFMEIYHKCHPQQAAADTASSAAEAASSSASSSSSSSSSTLTKPATVAPISEGDRIVNAFEAILQQAAMEQDSKAEREAFIGQYENDPDKTAMTVNLGYSNNGGKAEPILIIQKALSAPSMAKRLKGFTLEEVRVKVAAVRDVHDLRRLQIELSDYGYLSQDADGHTVQAFQYAFNRPAAEAIYEQFTTVWKRIRPQQALANTASNAAAAASSASSSSSSSTSSQSVTVTSPTTAKPTPKWMGGAQSSQAAALASLMAPATAQIKAHAAATAASSAATDSSSAPSSSSASAVSVSESTTTPQPLTSPTTSTSTNKNPALAVLAGLGAEALAKRATGSAAAKPGAKPNPPKPAASKSKDKADEVDAQATAGSGTPTGSKKAPPPPKPTFSPPPIPTSRTRGASASAASTTTVLSMMQEQSGSGADDDANAATPVGSQQPPVSHLRQSIGDDTASAAALAARSARSATTATESSAPPAGRPAAPAGGGARYSVDSASSTRPTIE